MLFLELSIAAPRKVKRNFKGRGIKAKILNEKYEAKPEFLVKWGFKLNGLLWEGPYWIIHFIFQLLMQNIVSFYQVFVVLDVVYHIVQVTFQWLSSLGFIAQRKAGVHGEMGGKEA